ncbi:hypothetical protein Prubr_38680 [Polymorphospora rubra]|uniref:Uncharacterized protein n=1 Tax=Polymorphospora rubra TaxID=338584 RepID=A0A810N0D2_9ACTN|nr:hypothetical protein Prubr_38680 [Polymorphospora rubra]
MATVPAAVGGVPSVIEAASRIEHRSGKIPGTRAARFYGYVSGLRIPVGSVLRCGVPTLLFAGLRAQVPLLFAGLPTHVSLLFAGLRAQVPLLFAGLPAQVALAAAQVFLPTLEHLTILSGLLRLQRPQEFRIVLGAGGRGRSTTGRASGRTGRPAQKYAPGPSSGTKRMTRIHTARGRARSCAFSGVRQLISAAAASATCATNRKRNRRAISQ